MLKIMSDKLAKELDAEIINELQKQVEDKVWCVTLDPPFKKTSKEKRYFINQTAAVKCKTDHNKNCRSLDQWARIVVVNVSDVPKDHILLDSW